MNDLVERLRQPLMLHANPEQTNAERCEAADAIERLTKALEEARPFLEAYEPSDTEFGRMMAAQRDRALTAGQRGEP